MARERSDAQLEGCGACDHARRRAAKRGGEARLCAGTAPCNATTSVSPTRSGSDEEVCGAQGVRVRLGVGLAPFGRHASSGSCSSAALQPFASGRITVQWAQSRLLDWQAILVKEGGAQRQRTVQNRHVECVMHTNLREGLATWTPALLSRRAHRRPGRARTQDADAWRGDSEGGRGAQAVGSG